MPDVGSVNVDLLRNFAVAILALLNPVGKIPLWAELTGDLDVAVRKRMAWMVSATGAGVLVSFLLGGRYVLEAFSLDLSSFQAAGGILVLVIAVDMVKGRSTHLEHRDEEGSSPGSLAKERFRRTVVPLAVPMIAGPGSITIVIVFGMRAESLPNYLAMSLALLAVLGVVLLAFLVSPRFERHVDPAFFTVVTRIFGLILAGIAVQLLFEALGEAFPPLTGGGTESDAERISP